MLWLICVSVVNVAAVVGEEKKTTFSFARKK
jgi:hypothetical protein